MSELALILLTLVGYSSGAVLAERGKRVLPRLFDLVVVIALWTAALVTRAALGKGLAILVWLISGLVVGAGLTRLSKGKHRDGKQEVPATMQGAGRLRRLWEGWKAFAVEMGNYQGHAILAFFYFFVVIPIGLPMRLFGDPLRLRRVDGSSFWVERRTPSQGLEEAREQF